jgi:dipeptidyl aminopeptidase/acylaminoacyl peptidase
MRSTLFTLILAAAPFAFAAETLYEKPNKDLIEIINAPPPPTLSVSPTHNYAIILESVRHPSIEELAQPMLRLAGTRIDINTNGPHLLPHTVKFTLLKLSDGTQMEVSLPQVKERKLSAPLWAPDGKTFAFTNTTSHSIDLWIGSTATGKTHQVSGVRINGVINDAEGGGGRGAGGGRGGGAHPFQWMGDNKTLMARLVPAGRAAPPAEGTVPKGPHVQESLGHAGPVPTYEDMLTNPHDEDLFDYYATAQLAYVDTVTGKVTTFGKPGIFTGVHPSPDGKNFLVSRLRHPYDYLHPFAQFSTDVEVWDGSAKKLYTVANKAGAMRVPIGGVATGPRDYQWLPTENASLVWVEAMDGGNPKEKVPNRDRIVKYSAPFKGEPVEVFKTEQRFQGIQPLEKGGLALVEDFERMKRWVRTYEIDLSKGSDQKAKLIFERNNQDHYKDPGTPMMRTMTNGRRVARQDGDSIYLNSIGATPDGDRPFVDRYNLQTGQKERLFQSTADHYEVPEAVLDDAGTKILTRRESPTEYPNYFIRTGADLKQITHFKDPVPQLGSIKKQLVKYKRADGVPLSFTLYLPPNYQQGTKLPTFVWAYPYEFNDADTAGQVTGSTNRFPELSPHLLMVLRGYAVLENAGMPVIGNPETVNNTYLDQIVMDAKAAIDTAVGMGVTDREKVGVGGHSYGAFMTANLLAHSELFHAGVAESGAYNRTLTPFGFQSEQRTIWQAPDVYIKMSPFMSADKIKTPILLVHGEADDNTGTFPINSERLYAAVRGNGGTVRLVFLPLEAHGYAARETIETVLNEELTWLDKYLKGVGPENTTSPGVQPQQ